MEINYENHKFLQKNYVYQYFRLTFSKRNVI